MKLLSNNILDMPAPSFELPATDGKRYTYEDIAGEKGTVVVFICNHCPYVKAIIDRMVTDAKVLMEEGFGFVAISSNDANAYPADSFSNMSVFAEKHHFDFPYLYDESQEVAKAYDAVCTPDIYGMSSDGIIKYHGRLDVGRIDAPPVNAVRDLVEAMRLIAATGEGPEEQYSSIGCSIKWR